MTEVEKAYMAFVRHQPCVAAARQRCNGRPEFGHLKHDGMGGSKTNPVIGNGYSICTFHHTGPLGIHHVGQQTFQKTHGVDLAAIAAWYHKKWDDGFLQGTPPKGAA